MLARFDYHDLSSLQPCVFPVSPTLTPSPPTFPQDGVPESEGRRRVRGGTGEVEGMSAKKKARGGSGKPQKRCGCCVVYRGVVWRGAALLGLPYGALAQVVAGGRCKWISRLKHAYVPITGPILRAYADGEVHTVTQEIPNPDSAAIQPRKPGEKLRVSFRLYFVPLSFWLG